MIENKNLFFKVSTSIIKCQFSVKSCVICQLSAKWLLLINWHDMFVQVFFFFFFFFVQSSEHPSLTGRICLFM